MSSPLIEVVAAVVLENDRVLLCQRTEEPHLALLWEFPGGKIDPGEAPEEALARELREELEVDSHIGERITAVEHRYPEKRVRIQFFHARIDGEPQAIVHRQLQWVVIDELANYEVPPANRAVVEMIRNGAVR